jgi:hypothetical protein
MTSACAADRVTALTGVAMEEAAINNSMDRIIVFPCLARK